MSIFGGPQEGWLLTISVREGRFILTQAEESVVSDLGNSSLPKWLGKLNGSDWRMCLSSPRSLLQMLKPH